MKSTWGQALSWTHPKWRSSQINLGRVKFAYAEAQAELVSIKGWVESLLTEGQAEGQVEGQVKSTPAKGRRLNRVSLNWMSIQVDPSRLSSLADPS